MKCPDPLPRDFILSIERLGQALAEAEWRPHPSKAAIRRWDRYVRKWAADSRKPLLVRKAKSGLRGSQVRHDSGRMLVPTDNSPAHWVFRKALSGAPTPNRLDLRSIPLAFVMTKAERARADFDLIDASVRFGIDGWHLCHMQDVRLGSGDIRLLSIEDLKAHFLRFMSPSNMFLAPSAIRGFGEMPQVIEAIARHE